MFDEKVIIRFLDGRVLKAYGDSFLPWEEEMLVKDAREQIVHVKLSEVKLIGFVKEFDSDGAVTHRPSPPLQYVAVPGKRVLLKFRDGEEMVGMTSLESPPKQGFFLMPLNPNSNNNRVFVNPGALASFHFEA